VSGVELVLALVKIAIVLLFLLNMAAIATWADRRQSAMIQDRVGPNRAVAMLPNMVARALVFAPAILFGVLAMLLFFRPVAPRAALERLQWALQLTALVGWFSLMVLCGTVRRSGAINRAEQWLADIDPRSFFFGGVALHVLVFAAARLVPRDAATLAAQAAGGLLWVVVVCSGFYAAARIPDGPVPLRLAGMLHAAADAVKLFMKEDFVPKNADRLLHGLAPIIALFPALVTFAIIPFGDKLCFADGGTKGVFDWSDLGRLVGEMPADYQCTGHTVSLQIADLNVGILYLFAMAGTGVIGAAIAGWASDNKFALLGGLRAASQMVSYEVAMGLSLVGLFMIYGTVRLGPMVDWQNAHAWGIFVQPVAFFLFLTALAAEGKRVPFDQPEGESEIVAGYFVEYSGMKFGMFFTGEYIELITSSALLCTLFLGGFSLPFLQRDGIMVAFGDTTFFQFKMTHLAVSLISFVAFFAKTILVVWVQIFFRWTLPRFRYDQLMKLGWTKLLPLSIANLLVTGIVILALASASPTTLATVQLLGDATKALLVLLSLAALVALIAGLLEPVSRQRFLRSTTARFAAAAGGTRASAQQA
jgi:NADH-quinone oxidoreductase subunit H